MDCFPYSTVAECSVVEIVKDILFLAKTVLIPA
jgi:hypothetical protein